REGISIQPETIQLPATNRSLLVEMAGGLMVPLTKQFLVLDLIVQLKLPVVLVSRYYLGSINHTILSAAVLRQANVPVLGLVFNGTENKASREAILRFTGLPVLGHVHQEAAIDVAMIQRYAEQFRA
ncbi:MAG: ATP-dependent dethiobiotin synthetase BioD, partial [Bacteroidota bacterium]